MPEKLDLDFGIGELSERTGVRIANIRYYETVGLLPKAARRNGRHRTYDAADVKRLQFIRNARETGFGVDAVRSLLHLAEPKNESCEAAKELSIRQLREVRTRMRDLKRIEQDLIARIAACDADCQCGRASDCAVLNFADPVK